MSIQKKLGEFPELPEPYHVMNRYADSYSRQLDHEVAEWEQPYGYDIRPLEPLEFEAMEHKYDNIRK